MLRDAIFRLTEADKQAARNVLLDDKQGAIRNDGTL